MAGQDQTNFMVAVINHIECHMIVFDCFMFDN